MVVPGASRTLLPGGTVRRAPSGMAASQGVPVRFWRPSCAGSFGLALTKATGPPGALGASMGNWALSRATPSASRIVCPGVNSVYSCGVSAIAFGPPRKG